MGHKKVLLVDDSRLMLSLGQTFLGGRYDVVTAASGPEALVKAARERPDLILMDVNMPAMSGREAAARLGRDEGTCDIPVVLVTTASEAARDRSRDYVLKPFDAAALVDKVRQYLDPDLRVADAAPMRRSAA